MRLHVENVHQHATQKQWSFLEMCSTTMRLLVILCACRVHFVPSPNTAKKRLTPCSTWLCFLTQDDRNAFSENVACWRLFLPIVFQVEGSLSRREARIFDTLEQLCPCYLHRQSPLPIVIEHDVMCLQSLSPDQLQTRDDKAIRLE